MNNKSNRLSHKAGQRGDTIIEVLLAMVVIGMALGIGYAISNSAFNTGRNAQERTEALKLAESELERMRDIAPLNEEDPAKDIFVGVDGNLFCIDETSLNRQDHSSTELPLLEDDIFDPTVYSNTACIRGRYHIATEVLPNDVFNVHVRWQRIGGGGNDEVSLLYKLYASSSGVVAGASLPPEPPIPQDCQDVSMPGDYFIRFDRWPDTTILGYALQNHPDPDGTPLVLQHTVETPVYTLGYTLPTGNYDVWLYSWDLHSAANSQTEESFYVRLFNGNGATLVAESDPISDMPNPELDGSEPRIGSPVSGMYLVEQVNASLHLNNPVDSIVARHLEPAPPLPGAAGLPPRFPAPSGPYYEYRPLAPYDYKHSSIKAVCASFTYVS